MAVSPTLTADDLDRVLSALSHRYSRAVCHYFRYYPTEETSVHDIVQYILERSERDGDETTVKIHLYRETLPTLRDAGFIDYEARWETVRYHGSEALESLLDQVLEQGEGSK